MTAIVANGITLEYESLGDPAAPTVLLVMGLGMQLVAWPDAFCDGLVARGLRVVRFDNRDCGLSQKLDELGTPRVPGMILRALLGLPVRAPYDLTAMAADTAGLLDALGIAKAHVVGASMGGMIGQLVAALYPERVLSLTSIMSTTGARHLPQPSARIRRELLRRPQEPLTTETLLAHYERLFGVIGSPGYPQAPEEFRARIRRAVERGYHPAGFLRQLAAILANGDRSPLLGRITCPTLVIHGKADPLVPYQGGLFERFADMIAKHALESAPPTPGSQETAHA